MEQYPFFREEDEETLAVIGREAADSDLNGAYQKPYAVLTQKRLYCKNEGGNFIAEAGSIRSAKKARLPGQNWFLWGAVVCTLLVLGLLCVWYWGMRGWDYADYITDYAQSYIDDYDALEAKLPEYERTIKDYEEARAEIEQLQQELEDMDYAKLQQEANQITRQAEQLQAALEKAVENRNTKQRAVSDEESYIAECNRAIKAAERTIENTDVEENNQLKSQIDSLQKEISTYRHWKSEDSDVGVFYTRKLVRKNRFIPDEYKTFWLFDGQEFASPSLLRAYCGRKIEELQRKVSTLQRSYVDIDNTRESIEWNQRAIAQREGYLAEYQQQLEEAQKAVDTAQTEVNSFRSKVETAQAKVSEVEAFQADIARKQSALDQIPLGAAQNNIQRYQDSEADYNGAKRMQTTVGLFLPSLAVLLAACIILLVLTLLKRVKAAVIAAWVTGLIGLACMRAYINLGNAILQVFSVHLYYYDVSSMAGQFSAVAFGGRILCAVAILLGLLALWLNRKKTVFQIAHATGAFNFTPSLYPAEELKAFAEQVEGLKAGETTHA